MNICTFDVSLKIWLDKPEVYEDAPIGLQVVGQRLEEEAVLGGRRLSWNDTFILTL